MSKQYEYVVHPTHYNHDGRKECWDEWVDKYGADAAAVICLGNADKYLYRAGTKINNAASQDIAKARMYIEKAEQIIENSHAPVTVRTMRMYNLITEDLQKIK